MEHYVTLFDGLFLPQGVALHASLRAARRRLHALDRLRRRRRPAGARTLALPNVRLLAVESVENDRLRCRQGKPTRGEYCWTLTPFAPGFVFEADPERRTGHVSGCGCLADRRPRPIFAEFEQSAKAVLITEHGYAPEYDQTPVAGRSACSS